MPPTPPTGAQTVTFRPLISAQEITPGFDLAQLLWEAGREYWTPGLIAIITHKAVAKAEGRLVPLRQVQPSPLALTYAQTCSKDPRLIELVLQESQRIVRMTPRALIVQTKQGPICANAGIDLSNLAPSSEGEGEPVACLLPRDPDASARRLALELEKKCGFLVPIIISDSWGRPWREGIVYFALGSYGLYPFRDYRGSLDSAGRPLRVTRMASADALAAGAELACGKLGRAPFVLVSGFPWSPSSAGSQELLRPLERDLFP